MRHALTNVLFIAIAFLLCGAVEKPFALLRAAVKRVAGVFKSSTLSKAKNTHSKSAVTI